MAKAWLVAIVGIAVAIPPRLAAQVVKPETAQAFQCYAHAAEGRMASRKTFLIADSDATLLQALVRGADAKTLPGNGPNPHKVPGGLVFDWVGAVFIPSTTIDRTVRMLQDYDHRAVYFPEIISTARLLCRGGEDRFGFTMRLKEPAVIEAENDVMWERLDAHHWKCRSYSTNIREIGKQHNYLLRLDSYWRFADNGGGVFAEAETITLSGEFSSLMLKLGSLAGINPEKSLKKTLVSMRESLGKPGLEIADPPIGKANCGEPVPAPSCDLPVVR
jgi:hypothetical protein